MIRRITSRAAATALLLSGLGFTAAAFGADPSRAPFDQPLQVQHVTLNPHATEPGEKKDIRCFSFPHFMVKEIDSGEVGDEQLSIIPLVSQTQHLPCQATSLAGEQVIPVKTWSGYFLGVKGDYVFFSADDGVNGGMGFAVFHGAATASVFEDAVDIVHDHLQFHALTADAGGLRLRYARLYSGTCSVQTEGAACWAKLAAQTHLPVAPAPDCATGYLRARHELAAGRCEAQSRGKDAACIAREMERERAEGDDSSPSVITYEVEVVLRPAPAFTPLGGAMGCRPAD